MTSGCIDIGQLWKNMHIADQALVLMVRGLTLRWKQVIGYHALKHSISATVLQFIIKQAVDDLAQAGLFVDANAMDQESSQWKCVNNVGGFPETICTSW